MNQPNHDELARFAELDAKPVVPRIAGYLRYMGPGYLQSAMTLGGGSGIECCTDGRFLALFGNSRGFSGH